MASGERHCFNVQEEEESVSVEFSKNQKNSEENPPCWLAGLAPQL